MGEGAEGTSAERWEEIQELLALALEMDEAGRDAMLDERCGDDTELRAEVESLIEASEASDAYFDDLAGRAGITMSPIEERESSVDDVQDVDPRPDLIGTEIGRYEVLRWLGRGGMASVYLAERRGEGFTQLVALKLVLKPVSDPVVHRRSIEERQILARLEHRNIARLIDGGLTEQEFPFYAMEYVEGVDLLRYCDEHRLPLRDRLQLFLEVCAPVQYAHERLIIHCDLKPNNILVTADGHVKLLDFGVARLIDPESAGDDRTGLWFTPAYASPEMVNRAPTGTASDVYSLGVLLYEVLTGHRPYRFPSWSPDVVVETVGRVPPPAPSSVVTRPWQAAEDADAAVPPHVLAASRRSTPERIRRTLKGDLDAIVLKALAKDPADRYTTAAQLAGDIRRYLRHRPLTSVPDTARYRTAKFLRRHRGGAIATGVVVATLVSGVSATLWQAARATEAAELARAEAAKAERVAALMTDMFRLSDPNQVLGDTITARDLLDRGTERIQDEFGDQPLVQAELLAEVANVYRNLGLYTRAEALAGQALDQRMAGLGTNHTDVTESLVQLGSIQADLGLQAEAIETLERAIDVRTPLVDFPDSVLVHAQTTLGWLVRNSQRYDRAEELFAAALEGQRALDPGGPGEADLLFGLAATFHDSGMLDEADSVLAAVIAQRDPDARPTPMALGAIRNVGMIRRVREQYRDSEPILRAAVEMAEALYGPNHPEVFDTKTELGLALWGTGAWDEAEAVLRDGIEASTETLGPAHQMTAGLQEALGSVLVDQGDFEGAVVLREASLEEKIVRHGGEDHPGIVASLVGVAEALAGAGRFAEARAYIAGAEEMHGRLAPGPSVYWISTERSLGRMAFAEGDPAAAEAHFLRAIELAEELLNRPNHRYTVWARRDYGEFLTAVGRHAEAVEVLSWTLEAQIGNLGEPHPLIDRTRAVLRRARAG